MRGRCKSSTQLDLERDGGPWYNCKDVEAKGGRQAPMYTLHFSITSLSSLLRSIALATVIAMLVVPIGATSTSELVIYPTEATGGGGPVTIPAAGRWYYGPREAKFTNTSAVILNGADLCNAPRGVEGRVVITTEATPPGCSFGDMYVSLSVSYHCANVPVSWLA